jgi:predicted nucleic acid-binding protein
MLCCGSELRQRTSRCRNTSCSTSSTKRIDPLLTRSLSVPAADLVDQSPLTRSTPSFGRIVIVTDAGLLVAAFVDDGIWGDSARARLQTEELAAPELVDLEVTSALRGLHRVGKLNERRAHQALADLRELPLRRAPHRGLITRCWELRENLTTYDASYVALAELLGATLVTTDARLSRAPRVMCTIEVLSRATL